LMMFKPSGQSVGSIDKYFHCALLTPSDRSHAMVGEHSSETVGAC
jgi:hypothetical protein